MTVFPSASLVEAANRKEQSVYQPCGRDLGDSDFPLEDIYQLCSTLGTSVIITSNETSDIDLQLLLKTRKIICIKQADISEVVSN